MDPTEKPALGPPADQQPAANDPCSDKGIHWQVLLGELVHLIGVFLYYSRNSKESSRTDALFNQVIGHLRIILKMPGHDSGLLIRRIASDSGMLGDSADYQALYGNMLIHDYPGEAGSNTGSVPSRESALRKAFDYLAEMGIDALYLQIPTLSAENIEHLRFSMHIVARFDHAADQGASITFRYKDRATNVPVIHDRRGCPDPNLTLVAALNGLSAVNARELVKQAGAFETMQTAMAAGDQLDHSVSVEYNQIFKVRSLRSQIIKPLVEINNVPWIQAKSKPGAAKRKAIAAEGAAGPRMHYANDWVLDQASAPAPRRVPATPKTPGLARQAVQSCVDASDAAAMKAVDRLFDGDLTSVASESLADWIVAMTTLLCAIEKDPQHSGTAEAVLRRIHSQLAAAPDEALSTVVAKRRGLKINAPGGSVMIGMVHPRLFDLLLLVKERIDVRLRTAVVREIAFEFDPCHVDSLGDRFQLSRTQALDILSGLKACFGANGAFLRSAFEKRVDALAGSGNAVFEILWCFLKLTPKREDRLDLLNAIQPLMAKLSDTKRAMQFLLADVSQTPGSISYTDRNAFALANILLHTENRELYVDISRTPEAVLDNRRSVDQRIRHYVQWRLDADEAQFLAKSTTVHQFLEAALDARSRGKPEPMEARFLLALAREMLIFCAIVGGPVARIVALESIDRYSDASSGIYRMKLNTHMLSNLVAHLQTAVRVLGNVGHAGDVGRLKALEREAGAIGTLDSHPAHKLRVKQAMKWVTEALRTIQTRI